MAPTSTALIGREHPIGVIRSAVDTLSAGRGASVVLVGEPGIGKTALAAAARDEATRIGALTAIGSSWEGAGAPVLWPWVQVVRSLLRSDPAAELARDVARPALDVLLGEANEVASASGPEAEFRAFDALTAFLERLSSSRPVVVVLEDLQWADPPSVRTAEFVARHLAMAPVLLVATHRDDTGGQTLALDASLRALATTSTVLTLTGLDVASTGALFSRSSGHHLDAVALTDLHQRSGGNPFFVNQAAHLHAIGVELRSEAPGVRDAVALRLASRSSETLATLRIAAVLGREFERDIVTVAARAEPSSIDAALHEATVAGLVSVDREGHATFVHDLIREALQLQVDPDAERAIHAAAALALHGGADPSARVGMGAAHAVRAGSVLDPAVALEIFVAAADDARSRHAPDEEIEQLRRAAGVASPEHRSTLSLRLGSALVRAGRLQDAATLFRDEMVLARQVADARLEAEASLGLHSIGTAVEGSESLVGMLDDAAAALDSVDERSALTARVWAAQSQALTHAVGGDRARARQLGHDAVALARTVGDDEALGTCLLALHDAVWDAGSASERLAIISDMATVAHRRGDTELALQAGHLRVAALLELGRPEARSEHRGVTALARSLRLPRATYLALIREATMATIDANFDDALALISEAHELATRLAEPDRDAVALDQRGVVAVLRGRMDDVDEDFARARLAGDPHIVLFEATAAIQRGDVEGALARLPEIEALGTVWPRWAASIWWSIRTPLVAASGQARDVAALRASMNPVADTWAVLGGVVTVWGPIRHWLGVLAAASGDVDDAIDAFDAAATAARRLRAPVWETLAEVERASLLVNRRRPRDIEEARRVLDALAASAAASRMEQVTRRLADLRRQVDAASCDGAGSVEGRDLAVFRRDGDVWTLGFDGTTVGLPDSKGLADIHRLICNPGIEIAAVELLHGSGEDVARAKSLLGADPMLDEAARRAYRTRLDSLEEEIDAALARNRDDLASSLEAERMAIIGELASATGLGGRDRRLGDDAEKARKTVTARIRDALRRLDDRHPALAAHLRASVTTGNRCRYQPQRAPDWDT